MGKLSILELKLLKELRLYNSIYYKPPSHRFLMKKLGYKSPRSISLIIEDLVKKGHIEKSENGRISILKTELQYQIDESIETINLPLLGNVACGLPFLAHENVEDYLSVAKNLLDKNSKHFILRAKGDSMNIKNIFDGDFLVIRVQNHANDGDIIVALIDDEATIKQYYKKDEFTVLMPRSTNFDHKPIILSNDILIQGVVKHIIHKWEN